MFKCLKGKHVSGEEVSGEESQVPHPGTSKGKVSDVKKKKIAFTVADVWPLDSYLEKKTVHLLCALFVGKNSPTQLWPQPR